MMALATTVAAETSGNFTVSTIINSSSIIATVDASDTRIKVRRPAEWRLLDLSQPMIADKMKNKKSKKKKLRKSKKKWKLEGWDE